MTPLHQQRIAAAGSAAALFILLAAGCGGGGGDGGIDDIPPADTTGLSATPSGASVVVAWVKPASSDLGAVLVARFPTAPPDGAPAAQSSPVVGDSIGSGVVIYVGRGKSVVDSSGPVCSTSTYATWTRDRAGNWSNPGQWVTSAGGAATTPPSGLTARTDAGRVDLTWTNAPTSTGACAVRIVRKAGSSPTGPADGTVVHLGTGTSASEPFSQLMALTKYYYAAYSCNGAGVCETTGTTTAVTPTLVQALRAGGYVMRFRHATATACADRLDLGTASTTAVPDWWKSCDASCPPGGGATARQLDDQGRTEAASLGMSIPARGISIGRVITSEFCRNIQTAEGMAFGPPIEQRADITYFVHDEAGRCAAEYSLLAEAPTPGTNTVIIGHSGNVCSILDALAWGQAAIFKPDGSGGAQHVGSVLWNEWADLP